MDDLTQLSPTAGLPGGQYGDFSKAESGPHDPGPLTELSPTGGLPGGLYGDFSGKEGLGEHSPGPLTELSTNSGIWIGLYGDFGGKEPSVVVPPVEPPTSGGGGGVDHFLPTRKRQQVAARIIEGYMLAIERPDGFYATGDVYESPMQVMARRNARALRILLLSS